MHLAAKAPSIIHRLIVPVILAIATLAADQAFAQNAFPAPLPNGQSAASSGLSGSALERAPPVGGPAVTCGAGFLPLRAEAEKRGKLIKAASERHAPPDEACKLIGDYSHAELKMIKYVETRSTKCGISLQLVDQLKTGHKNTEALERKICAAHAAQSTLGPSGPLGDWGEWRQ